jgi:protein MpaA
MRAISQRGTFLAEPEVYGESLLRRSLEYWPAGYRTETLIVGGIHGEEPDTTVLLSRALRSIDHVPHGVAVVAAANPDGLVRGLRCNAAGVDLNRNFPSAGWRPDPVTHCWTLEHPSEVVLGSGSAPGSEPETGALIALIERLQPGRIVSLHGHLSCVDDPHESEFGRWLAERTALPLVTDIGYPTPGSMGEWAAEREIPIVTWEIPPVSIEAMFASQLHTIIEILTGRAPG